MNLLGKSSPATRRWLLATMICFGSGSMQVCAQETTVPKEKRSEEETEAIWRSQVATTSNVLSLPADKHERIAEVYINNRKARREASSKLSKVEQGSSEKKELADRLDDEAREKLRTSLAEVLTEEQVDLAVQSLGSFNPRWDRYVAQIRKFDLDDAEEKQAQRLAYDYIVEYGKARAAAKAANDRLSSVVARDLKAKLDDGLAKLLSKEQLAEWIEATAFKSGGGGGTGQNRKNQAGKTEN